MVLSPWLSRFRRSVKRRTRGRATPPPSRPGRRFRRIGTQVEVVEERTLLTTLTINVDTVTDVVNPGDGMTSLREAILQANAASQEEVVINLDIAGMPTETYTLSIGASGMDDAASGDLNITSGASVVIRGADDGSTAIDFRSGSSRVFHIESQSHRVEIEDLTLRGAVLGEGGGAILNQGFLELDDVVVELSSSDTSGGGLANLGTATVVDSVFDQNTASSSAGGAILNAGTLTVANSSLTTNTADLDGGAILNTGGFAAIETSTLSGNMATGDGGAIAVSGGNVSVNFSQISSNTATNGGGVLVEGAGSLFLDSSTLNSNTASMLGGGLRVDSQATVVNSTLSGNVANSISAGGGGISVSTSGSLDLTNATLAGNVAASGDGGAVSVASLGAVTTVNTIFADSVDDMMLAIPDVEGAFTSFGSNIIENTGTAMGFGGDTIADPQLGILQNNGGPTPTHLPAMGSPVLGAGNVGFAPEDGQRLVPRPVGGMVDIGAVQTDPNVFFVNTTSDTPDDVLGNGMAADAMGNTSLRAAVMEANFGGGNRTIIVPQGQYSLTRTNGGGIDDDANNDLDISGANIRLIGVSSLSTVIDGSPLASLDGVDPFGNDRVFEITGMNTSLTGVTIENGNAGLFDGGGILVDSGASLHLSLSSLEENQAQSGGGLATGFSSIESLRLENVTVVENTAAAFGGGVAIQGIFIEDSPVLLDSNVSRNTANGGGGVFVAGSRLQVTGTSLIRNTSMTDGGGLLVDGMTMGAVELVESTVDQNSAQGNGGGIASTGSADVVGSVVSNNSASLNGGGIAAGSGRLNVAGSSLTNNVAMQNGGGIALGADPQGPPSTTGPVDAHISFSDISSNVATLDGGAIANAGSNLFLFTSTLAGNTAVNGGGLVNSDLGTSEVVSSTISGNSAISGGFGGGLLNNGGTLDVTNATITQNSATGNGGGIASLMNAPTTVQNTISFNNTAGSIGPDAFAETVITSGGHNIVGTGGFGFINGLNNDQVGVNPQIDPNLVNNGGFTATHAILSGSSPAIDAGDNTSLDANDAESQVDQRGAERILDGDATPGAVVDVGAYEFGSNAIFVTTKQDVVAADSEVSLREAIDMANSNSGPDTIVVPAGKYDLTLFGAGDDSNVSGDLDITDDVTIVGYGMGVTVIDGMQNDRVFDYGSRTVTIRDLTIQNGQSTEGGGIRSQSSTTTLERVEVAHNMSTGDGGGIFNAAGIGTLNVLDSFLHDNVAVSGGAIANINDPLNVIDSRFENNRAVGPSGNGGAILIQDSAATITGSQFLQTDPQQTSALGRGGALFIGKQAFSITTTITDSRFAGHRAGSGGAIAIQDQTVVINGSEIAEFSDGMQTIGGNEALSGDGGGIENIGGDLTVTTTRIADNTGAFSGGGIINAGAGAILLLEDSVVENNNLFIPGSSGGGLFNDQTATIRRSTISGNQASFGAGIHNLGILTLVNSTLSANMATNGGGGLANQSLGSATIEHSTISQNQSFGGVTGGGGIFNSGSTVSLRNTIVAGNIGNAQNADLEGAFTSSGNNLIGDVDNAAITPGTGDIFGGTTALTISRFDTDGSGNITVTTDVSHGLNDGDLVRITDTDMSTAIPAGHGVFTVTRVSATAFSLNNAVGPISQSFTMENSEAFALADPQLGPLQNNTTPPAPNLVEGMMMPGGGGMPGEIMPVEDVVPLTHRPSDTSPVIDAGSASMIEAFDNRGPGFSRNVDHLGVAGSSPDIGAVEVFLTTVTGTKFDDVNGDGMQQIGTEFGLPDITVYADLNQNGILDNGDRFTTTDIDGDYVLELVPPGTTIVSEILPIPMMPGSSGTRQTFPTSLVTAEVANVLDTATTAIPQGVTSADLDSNGLLDVIYTRSTEAGISVLRQQTDGSFVVDQYAVGTTPLGVITADFNNDGFLDIAVANSGSANITLLQNLGNGRFVTVTTQPVGNGPEDLATGDFDGDGQLDLAVVNRDSNNVTILSGTGMGGFNAMPFAVPLVGNLPVDIAVGDVDRDGRLDLATADQGSDQVTLLINQGSGSFLSSTIPLPGSDVSALDAADVDRDGLVDLVVSRPGNTFDDVAVIFNRGSLTAFEIVSAGLVTDASDVQAVDLNGDGFPDIAAVSATAVNNLTLIEADPANGTFLPGVVSTSGDSPQSLATGDLNQDGRPDVLTANPASDDVTATLNLSGSQLLTTSTGVTASGVDFGNQQLASVSGTKFEDRNSNGMLDGFFDDFNLGSPDLLWQNEVGNWNVVGGEYVASAPGNNPLTYSSLPFDLEDFEVTFDVNGVSDGGVFLRSTAFDPDEPSGVLLVTNGTSLYWHIVTNGVEGAILNQVSGLFTAGANISLRVRVEGDTYSVFLNGAMTPATSLTTSMFSRGRFALYSNSGQRFDNVSLPERALPGVQLFLDQNDNGRQDPHEPVAISQMDDPATTMVDETGQYLFSNVVPGDVRIFEVVPPGFLQTTPGNLELSAAQDLGSVGDNAVDSLIADLDNDGVNDLVVLSAEASTGNLRVFAGTGTQYVNLAGSPVMTGIGTEAVAAGDLDGDGDLDLAVANAVSQNIQLFEDTGGLNFTLAATLSQTGDAPSDIELVDVDGDGRLDVVASNGARSTRGVLIRRNQSNSFTFDATVTLDAGNGQAVALATSDLDNDGDADIAVTMLDRAEIRVFENNSTPGNLMLAPAATVVTGSNPQAIVVGDITMDGRADLIIGRDASLMGSAIEVFPGAGLFGFGLAQGFESMLSPDSLSVSDVDEDHFPDLVFSDAASGQGGVLRGDGLTFFPSATLFPAGTMVTGVSTGDLDGDGRIDIVAVEETVGAQARALFNRTGSLRVSLTAGSQVFNQNFGNIELATITGTKFHDLNQDGDQDMGEPGLPGFTIYTDDNENGQRDPGENSAVTDENGQFTLAGVDPGRPARVREVQQPGFIQTEPNSFLLDVPVSLPVHGGSRGANIGDVIASGDFDGDGLAEIVSANPGAGSVSVVGFEAEGTPIQVDLAVGSTPLTVRVADLNADGHLDIITANNGSNNVSVILGNGDGTFQGSSEFAAGPGPQSLTIADVDGGGTPDVVVSSNSSSNLQVLSNNGTGFLASPVAVSVAGVTSGEDVEAGDFDMDGDIDLAVVSGIQNRVSILLNAGGGTFGAATAVAVGSFPLGTAVGDFDEDGDLDLVVSNTADSTLQFLLNNGSGSFMSGATTAVGGSPEAVAVGDVNGDGHLDVVAANQVQTGVNILLGDGMGGFAVTSGAVGTSQDGVALGDLNADGRPDILTETFGQGSVTALLNLTGTRIVPLSSGEMASGVDFGNFALPGEISGTKYHDLNENGVRDMGEPGLQGFTIFLDEDNDDILDGGEQFTITDADGNYSFTGLEPLKSYTVSELQRNGFVQLAPASPGFVFTGDVFAGGTPGGIVTGDFDNDMDDDIAVTLESSNQVAILLRGPGGVFGMPTLIPVGNTPFAIVAADFDQQPGLDLAVANEGDGTITILENDGNGAFTAQPMAINVVSAPVDLAVADFDGTSGPDLAVANGNGQFRILLNDGAGTLTVDRTLITGGTSLSSITAADFDLDGDADVAMTRDDNNTLLVYLQDPMGGFTGQLPITTGIDPSRVRSADLNNDGTEDLIVVNQQSSDVTVVINNSTPGSLMLAPPTAFSSGLPGESLALLDLNRDGLTDAVVTGEDQSDLAVLVNDGSGGFLPPVLSPLDDTEPVEVAPIRLNADGDLDLVITDGSFSDVVLLTSTVGSYPVFVGAGAALTGLDFGNREINDPPSVTAPAMAATSEDTGLVFGGNVSISDPDAGASSVKLTLTATEGTVTLATVSGLMFTSGSNGSAAMTFTGTVASINAALNGMTFNPNLHFNGTAFLDLDIDDLGNTGFGGPQMDSAQVEITVNSVNDAPVITFPSAPTLNEDDSVALGAISISDADIGGGTADVMLSVMNGTLTLATDAGLTFSGPGGNGQSQMTIRGNLGNINAALASVTYAPNLNFNGLDSLSVLVNDLGNTGGPAQMDSGNLSITVDAINDGPVATVPATQAATEDMPKLIMGLSVADVDAGSNDVRATLTAGNGTITLDDGVVGGLGAGDITGNGQSSVVLSGTIGEINLTLGAGITYLGDVNFNGSDSVTLLIEDLGNSGETPANPLSDSKAFTVDVASVNDAPVVISPGTQVTNEDTSILITGFSVSDADAGSNDVVATLSATDGTISVSEAAGADVLMNNSSLVTLTGTIAEINAKLGEGVTYQGNLHFNGADAVTLTVNDQGFTGGGGNPTTGLIFGGSARTEFENLRDTVGDTYIDFESLPNGTLLDNELIGQGVQFATISDVNGNPDGPGSVIVSTAFAESGTRSIIGRRLPAGADGRTTYEITFTTPQRRAGVLRSTTNGITRFFAGATLLAQRTVATSREFVGFISDSADEGDWITRIELDGLPVAGSRQVLFTDDLFFGRAAPLNPQMDQESATVTVNAVNDAPTFDAQPTTFNLAEHSASGTPVHTVAVSDVDSPSDLTFSIVSGNTGNAFAINTVTGQITVNDSAALDFEAVGSFPLQVRVTDSSVVAPTPLTSDQVFTVNLTDIAEPFVVGPGAFSSGAVTLVRDGALLRARQTGTMTDVVPAATFSNVTDVSVQARNGMADELTVDFSGGDPLPASGLSFNGGSGLGIDTLVLTGGSATSVGHTLLTASSGSVAVDGTLISYSEIEPISDSLDANDRSFTYGSGADSVTFSDGTPGDNRSRLEAPGTGETVDFRNPSGTLTILLGDGDDVFRTPSTDSMLTATVSVLGGAGADDLTAEGFMAGGLTIDGEGGADNVGGSPGNDLLLGGDDNDTFFSSPGDDIMNGGGGNDLLFDEIDDGNDQFIGGGGNDSLLLDSVALSAEVTVNGADSGLLTAVSGQGPSTVSFTQIENAQINAAVQQTLSVDYSNLTGPAEIQLTESEGLFALSGQNLLPLTFGDVGQSLVINGTGGNDTVTVSGLASFDAGLEISGGSGTDKVAIPAGLPSDGFDGDIRFTAEQIELAGLVKTVATLGQAVFNGVVTLTGDATVEAPTFVVFGSNVETGSATLTVNGNTQLSGPSTVSGTVQLNGDVSSSATIILAGPAVTVTGDANFSGAVSQAGSLNISQAATFSGPLTVQGTIVGGTGLFRLQNHTELVSGTISTNGLIEVGVPMVGPGDEPALTGEGTVSADNLLILNGTRVAPEPLIEVAETQLQAGATIDLTDLNDPSGSTRLRATGALNLGGAELTRTESTAVPFVSQLLVNKTSPGVITGIFANLPEGAALDVPVSDGLPGETRRYAITYQGGDGNDVVLIPVASISGIVFADNAPENGIRDEGNEAGVAGVDVELVNDQGITIAQTTTVAEGGYSFNDLLAGNYTVRFLAPEDRHFTDRNQGLDDNIDSDASVLTGEATVAGLVGGESRQNVDAGLVATTIQISDPVPVNEGSGSPGSFLSFEITLNGRSPHQVSVHAQVTQGTDGQPVDQATLGQDMLGFPAPGGVLPVVFNPGQTSQVVTVPIVGDLELELDEGFEVRLSDPVQATVADAVGFGLIRNDDFAAPTVVFGENAMVVEGQFPAEPLLELTIRLDGGTVDEDLFVSYRTVTPSSLPSGIAEPGTDFRAIDDVAVIPAGQNSVTVRIPVIGDSLIEPDEMFSVELTGVAGGSGRGVTLGMRTVAQGTIKNDDLFVPVVSVGDASVTEVNGPAFSTMRFPVTLSGPAASDTRIAFSTIQLSGSGTATAGTDFRSFSGASVLIPQGQVSATIAVPVFGDQIDETDEVFGIELGAVLQGNVTVGEGVAVGTIIDDDDPILLASISAASVTEGPSGRVSRLPFTLSLSGDATQDVSILVSTLTPNAMAPGAATPGVDFVPLTNRVVRIPAGRRMATFNVEILGDAVDEANEFFTARIVSVPAGLLIDLPRSAATATIIDDDDPRPVASIDASASTTETRPGLTTVVSIPVRLSAPSSETVTVDFATVPSIAGIGVATDVDNPSTAEREDDFRARTGTLTFAPGQQQRQIRILVNGDAIVEPPETFAVELTGISTNADLSSIATRSVATIFDDDVAVPSVSIIESASAGEPDNNGVTPVNLTVTMDGRLTEDVVVGYTIPFEDGPGLATPVSDFVPVDRGEVTIEAGQSTATITVLVNGDVIAENEEQFFVQLLDVSPVAEIDLNRQQSQITIIDNDAALPSVSITDATVFEGDPAAPDGVAPIDDPRLNFTVSLSSVPTGPVSVEVATRRFSLSEPGVANTDGPDRDVFATRRILFFDPTITSQVFSVRVEPDFEFEADEVVLVDVVNPIGAVLSADTVQGVGTVLNDDFEQPTVSISSISVLEGDTPGEVTAVLTATLDADPEQGTIPDVAVGFRTLPLSATANVDFTPVEGVLTFAGTRTQTVEIPILGDLENEGAEEFFVELFDLNDGVQMVELNPEAFQGLVRIDNDDSPNVRFEIDSVRQREGTGGTTDFTFTVRRTGISSTSSTVQFATSAGTSEAGEDFVGRSGTLIFTPTGPDTQTVTIPVVGDSRLEEEFETFFVTLSNPTNATIAAGAGQGTGTILDDDQRVFSEDANAALQEVVEELRERFAGAALNDPAVTAFFEQKLREFAAEFGPVLGIILDPVDFLLTDLEQRTVGYTEADGEVSEVPRAFYSGDGDVELVVIPAAEQGVYGLQLTGVDSGEFRSTATLVTAEGFTKTISNVDVLSGDLELALDFTEEDALPLRNQVIEELADQQDSPQQPIRTGEDLALADDVAAAIEDMVFTEESIIDESPQEILSDPFNPQTLRPFGKAFRRLRRAIASQTDPLPDLAPWDPETEQLLDEVYSGLGQVVFGAPGDLLFELIDLLNEFGEDDSESEGEGNGEETGDETDPPEDNENAALERLLESRRMVKAQREALRWLEQRREAEAAEQGAATGESRANFVPAVESRSQTGEEATGVERKVSARGKVESEPRSASDEIPQDEA